VARHQRKRLVEILVGFDGDEIARDDISDLRGFGIGALGDAADHDVAVGHDSDQAAGIDDGYRSRVIALHHLGRHL
jgi:hypothetical protein